MAALVDLVTRIEFLVAAVVIVGGTVAVLRLTRSRRQPARRRPAPGGKAAPPAEPTAGRRRGRVPVGARPVPVDAAPPPGRPSPVARAGDGRSDGRAGEAPAPPPVTFADVAGLDEAIAELRDVKEYLTDPARFRALGAELPRGILLYGLPGCGKTLLARALAGETGVPFYNVSASSFVERFVGMGAARVRELFEEAKDHAPSIVFIDELDAIGRKRNADSPGEREYDHTLNQLLVELDGFLGATGVLLVGATNRPELIDQALLRPGRFDRRIKVDRPDLDGREKILLLHASRRPFSRRVDWREVAASTAGLTAAELANIVNEASLLAARRHRQRISPEDVDEACARVLAGTRSSRLMGEDEKRLLAVHEAGHALLTLLLRGMRPPPRISIVSRAGAFDRSIWSAGTDREIRTKHELLAQLIVLLGGRAAELNAFGEPSTRAEDDLEHAAALARRMVERWAMTGRFELAAAKEEDKKHYFEGSAGAQEVRSLVARAEHAARTILADHVDRLRVIATALETNESLTAVELERLHEPARLRPGGVRPVSRSG